MLDAVGRTLAAGHARLEAVDGQLVNGSVLVGAGTRARRAALVKHKATVLRTADRCNTWHHRQIAVACVGIHVHVYSSQSPSDSCVGIHVHVYSSQSPADSCVGIHVHVYSSQSPADSCVGIHVHVYSSQSPSDSCVGIHVHVYSSQSPFSIESREKRCDSEPISVLVTRNEETSYTFAFD